MLADAELEKGLYSNLSLPSRSKLCLKRDRIASVGGGPNDAGRKALVALMNAERDDSQAVALPSSLDSRSIFLLITSKICS